MPLLKPPARARRMRALHRHGERVALTPQAIEQLFRDADVLAEGSLAGDPDRPVWYGSVMITFHLDRLAACCRGLADPAQMERVVEAIAGSVRVRLRAHRLACAQVYERYPDRQVGTVYVDTRFSRVGERLLLDVDLEAPVEVVSSHRGAR